MRIFLCLSFIAFVGCSKNDLPTEIDVNMLPITVDVGVGQTVRVTGEGISLTFDSVTSDTRCPLGLECFWEGDAGAQMRIQGLNVPARVCTLHTSLEPKLIVVNSVKITLKRVVPYPKVGLKINPLEYVVSLELTKDTIPGAIAVLPVVRVTGNNYEQPDIQARVPDTVLFHSFIRAYNGLYSDDLKRQLILSMQSAVQSLGLSQQEFLASLKATGQTSAGVVSLPYLAERARYEGEESWIYEFTWGVSADDLEHRRCFVMDAANADTLLFLTCR